MAYAQIIQLCGGIWPLWFLPLAALVLALPLVAEMFFRLQWVPVPDFCAYFLCVEF